jgi:hypothetical protein
MSKKKTFADFQNLVSETKVKYMNERLEHGWNYTVKEEELGEGLHLFMVCNIHNATKIIFNDEFKMIVQKDIIMADVRILCEMKEQLK